MQSLDTATGKIVSNKVNALLDMGNKTIFEITTEPYRAINTTGNHPYLVKLYSKEKCDKYKDTVWNKNADKFNEYCTRWVEVRYLKDGNYIAVPNIENDLNNNNYQGSVVERARSLTDKALLWLRRGCEFENGSEISPRSHLYRNDKTKEEINQVHSWDKTPIWLRRVSHEFFLDYGNCRNQHTVKSNMDNNYLNISVYDGCGTVKVKPSA